jgi:hypothetical protein
MNTLKYTIYTLILLVTLQSCKDTTKTIEEKEVQENAYSLKGEAFNAKVPKTSKEMATLYKDMKPNDTLVVAFEAKVNAVCQNKGCWMKLEMPNSETAMVKFKDYGFFMPKDIAEDTVVVHGKAFIQEVSVDEQRHYAEDAGKTKEEVEAITEPKRTYSFLADGVLVPESEGEEIQTK